jgi:hypothetical protein
VIRILEGGGVLLHESGRKSRRLRCGCVGPQRVKAIQVKSGSARLSRIERHDEGWRCIRWCSESTGCFLITLASRSFERL